MKLRNKRTGEIAELDNITVCTSSGSLRNRSKHYNSIAELNEELEDYEEPKVGFIIEPMEEDCVSADDLGYEESDVERAKELGLWFESKEEAERAVEKLKAYKRLKYKGFRFKCCDDYHIDYEFTGKCAWKDETEADLDLLFGEEEE